MQITIVLTLYIVYSLYTVESIGVRIPKLIFLYTNYVGVLR